jgi:hypothetical protein
MIYGRHAQSIRFLTTTHHPFAVDLLLDGEGGVEEEGHHGRVVRVQVQERGGLRR